ncbi:unnamed protein product [Peniophora sp. CBMAI 1063]|nr:unnamed protein product [Peniophora sp. CBMAI 1063]
MASSMSLLRRSARVRLGPARRALHRSAAVRASAPQHGEEGMGPEGPGWSDPRPPWMYTSVSWAQWIICPAVAIYGVFFMDFGDREHAFMPARRWLQRQKAAFFTLSPEEQKYVEEFQQPKSSKVYRP